MSLKEQLNEDMKDAMKAKDKLRLSVIRMAKAAVKNAEISKLKEFDDPEVVEVLAKEVKMRRDAIIEFDKANRPEEVAKLNQEIAILMGYMPRQMTEEEIRELARQIVSEVGAQGPKDLGKVMGAITPKTKGRADGRMVNQIVKELLQA